MRQRLLGATGRHVSAIGLGAMPLAITGRPSEAVAIRVVHAALDLGVSWIDVADSYALDEHDVGYGERLVQRALASWPGARENILVTTKGGYVRPGGAWELDGRPSHLRAACEASLKALGVESLFLYQLHGPDPRVYFPDSVGALAELRRAGKIEHVGLCNVDALQLEEAARIVPIASVQNRFNAHDRHCLSNGVIDWCERNGAALIAHSPVGGHTAHPRIARDPVLGAVAARHGATPYEIAIAYLLSLSEVVLPIPGASRPASIASSARAAELLLAAEDLAELQRAFPPANVLVRRLVRARSRARHVARTLRSRVGART
jgi:aryl-alcohol dehydrogenase-like predicted oxidoreductase